MTLERSETQIERFFELVRITRIAQRLYKQTKDRSYLKRSKEFSGYIDAFLDEGRDLDEKLKPIEPISVEQGDFFND